MQRHRRPQDSSLELLLDTICNTFGGVLFLAMLTSLMLAQTQRDGVAPPAQPGPAVSMAELLRLDTRAKSATFELLNLREQVRHHGYEYRLIPGDAPIHEGAVDVSVQ
jgi:hypothetical protein